MFQNYNLVLQIYDLANPLFILFLLLTGGTTVYSEENTVKENAKAHDSNRTEKATISAPLKGNSFYQYYFCAVTNDCLNVLK